MTNQFQYDVEGWLLRCMGSTITYDKQERNFRFGEEAIELLQAAGASKEDVLALVDYVYDRTPGDVRVEIGDTMVCLAALATAHEHLSIVSCADESLTKCEANIDLIREKHARKQLRTDHSPLPGDGKEERK